MAIQSLGVGSGLDISNIVTQLVAAERVPKETRLNNREIQLQARISAMGAIKSLVSDFQKSYLSLKLASSYSKISATSSDTAAFGVTASATAAEGTHTIQVNQLAQSQILTSGAQADTTTSIGTGSLVFNFAGGSSQTVTISDGSLSGIKDAINSANVGVTANVVYNGTGYVLSLEGKTGADNAFSVVAKDAGGLDIADATGLGTFEYDALLPAGPGSYMSSIQSAQNSAALFDGVSVSSATNTITNPIAGVELTLKKADIGVNKTLTIAQNTSAITSSVSKLVDSYNALKSSLNDLTYYNKDTGDKGLFLGDSVVRGIESRVRKIMTQTVGGPSVQYNSFAAIGVTTTSDGTLELDSSKLSSALTGNLDQVRDLFIGNGGALQTDYLSSMSFANLPTGKTESDLKVNITQVATNGQLFGGNINNIFEPYLVGTVNTARPDFTLNANHNFSVTVDGVETVALDFTATQLFSGLNMGNDFAVYLQSQINAGLTTKSVKVAYESGSFKITSDTYGSASSISISAPANAAALSADLGFTAGAGITGKDVAGTIGLQAATGLGQVLTANDGTDYDNGAGANLAITYTGKETTARIDSQKVGGMLGNLDDLLDSFLDSDGIFNARNDGYNNQLDDIELSRERLNTRISAIEARLISQFSAMDALVANLNSTGDFISNQLQNLPGTSRK